MNRTLSIDIETRSSVNIKTAGMYKYAESEDFDILLLAYKFDDEPTEVIDLAAGEKIPPHLLAALFNSNILKTAHNAAFERVCLLTYISKRIGFEYWPSIMVPKEAWKTWASQWECTMVKSAMCGLPMQLDQVASVLRLPVQKMKEGKALIRFFCSPVKPTEANNYDIWNLPAQFPEKWATFKQYNITDVDVEYAIRKKLEFYKITDFERKLYHLDQRINDKGALIDTWFVNQAIKMDAIYKDALVTEARELTGLDNPNSAKQLTDWLEEAVGDTIPDLKKLTIPALLKKYDDATVQRMLRIRQQLSRTSIRKYTSMLNCVGNDGRIRGLLQHYGAGRTGRWAGRLVQVQNLTKMSDEFKELVDDARELVRDGDLELITAVFGDVPDVLAQLIRTSFIAGKNKILVPSDFSAIEARVIAWAAGENWRLKHFRQGGDIYIASAAQMFNLPIESIGKKSDIRQKGKIAELALGYGGGRGAMETMDTKKSINPKEYKSIVASWREANPAIVNLWYDMEAAAIKCIQTKEPQQVKNPDGSMVVTYSMQAGALFLELPSGRKLTYLRAKIAKAMFQKIKFLKEYKLHEVDETTALNATQAIQLIKAGYAAAVGDPFTRDQIVYEGMNQTTRKWSIIPTYGGKLVENLVQAIARDCLAEALVRLDEAGYEMIFHVHDEAVIEADFDESDERFLLNEEELVNHINSIMGAEIPWAQGLPLTADSYTTNYYKKD